MPRSLDVLQLCLAVAVVLLVVAADLLHSWDAVEFTDSDESPPESVQHLSFAPQGYCMRRVNGSSECHPFVNALLSGAQPPTEWSDTSLGPLPKPPPVSTSTQGDQALDEALACWCQVHGDLSWVSRGAKHMVCLAILETCQYTTALWASFAMMEVGLGFSALVLPSGLRGVDACRAFTSYASAMLSVMVMLEWWGYSSVYIDRESLTQRGLYWHHDTSFHLATVALVLTLLSTAITLHGLGIHGARNYAQLHAFSRNQRQQDGIQEPLSCPANYLV